MTPPLKILRNQLQSLYTPVSCRDKNIILKFERISKNNRNKLALDKYAEKITRFSLTNIFVNENLVIIYNYESVITILFKSLLVLFRMEFFGANLE